MRGLFQKDFKIITYRKKYFVIFLAIAILLSLRTDGYFIVSYLALAGMALAISSVSYDEFDNGLAFLMTLPATRKQFALEKHLFGCLTITCFWAVGVLIQLVVGYFRPELPGFTVMLPGMLLFLGVFIAIMSILLPIEIYFGTEKSRVALMVLFGVCFAVGIMGEKITAATGFDPSSMIDALRAVPAGISLTCGLIILLLVFAASTAVTMRIMDKKEF